MNNCRLYDDILVSKAEHALSVWKWLSLDRYFDKESEEPRVFDYIQKTDYQNSRMSFFAISRGSFDPIKLH